MEHLAADHAVLRADHAKDGVGSGGDGANLWLFHDKDWGHVPCAGGERVRV